MNKSNICKIEFDSINILWYRCSQKTKIEISYLRVFSLKVPAAEPVVARAVATVNR